MIELEQEINNLNYLSQVYFNDQKPLLAYLLPNFLQRYNIDNKKYSEKALFNLATQYCQKINDASKQFAAQQDKKITFDLKPKSLLGLEKIYANNPDFDFIIHGSYADNSATAASDVDDLVILKKEVFTSFSAFRQTKRLLNRLGLIFQAIDPLQHHGHWILTEYDLNNYNQSYMPLSVLKDAHSVGRSVTLNVSANPITTAKGYLHIYKIILNEGITDSAKLFQNKLNAYGLKNLISSISLSIPLAFQLRGEEINKKDAISNAHTILDQPSLRVLEWASKTRTNWTNLGLTRHYSALRFLHKIIRNRNLLDITAKFFLPPIKFNRLVPNDLTESDFVHFFKLLQEKADENY